MRIVGLQKIWPFFFACRNSDRRATIRLSRCLPVTASRAAMDRRDPQGGVLGSPRAVHLVDRALDDPTGHPMDLDPVPQLQE